MTWITGEPYLFGQQQTGVTGLEGTKITGAEIDKTITRLMSAAGVTGTGIAIIDGGKIAYMFTPANRSLVSKFRRYTGN